MERQYNFSLYHTILLLFAVEAVIFAGLCSSSLISRDDFPPGFIFGAGTSAYQVEGAATEGGRKPSIWDIYALTGKNLDHSTANITADQYHKYKEDVKLMHDTNLDAYRFSISWSRLIPDGRGLVNPEGLRYYNNLIDELVSYGIEPHVTLYHFDLPQALQDEYQGFLSTKIVEDFTAYAEVCFKEFGDRVKHWITFNEPNIETILGYDVGLFPPGRCSDAYTGLFNCSGGDSTTEPYRSAHNVLLAHASAVALYREKYLVEQHGQIGITILAFWFEPFTSSPEDIAATERLKAFHLGWFIEPLMYGDYPAIMRKTVGSRLPLFDEGESDRLRGSFDFIGLNHYCFYYIESYPNNMDKDKRDYIKDISVTIPGFLGESSQVFSKRKIGEFTPFPVTPWALQKLLDYIKVTYENPPVVIHENGYADFDVSSSSGIVIDDDKRVGALQGYIESLLQSIRNGSNLRGYFVWSFLDCFELMFGYTARYGLYAVDFSREDRRRYPRLSAHWYSDFLKSNVLRNRASDAVGHAERVRR